MSRRIRKLTRQTHELAKRRKNKKTFLILAVLGLCIAKSFYRKFWKMAKNRITSLKKGEVIRKTERNYLKTNAHGLQNQKEIIAHKNPTAHGIHVKS